VHVHESLFLVRRETPNILPIGDEISLVSIRQSNATAPGGNLRDPRLQIPGERRVDVSLVGKPFLKEDDEDWLATP